MTGIRSYLAGTGAGGSLLAAALVAFVSVTAFVAFDGVPIGSGEDGAETVSIDGPAAAAATAAAAAGPPATVAATPAGPAAAAAAPGAPGPGPGATADGAPGGGPGAAPGAGAPGGGSATAGDVPAPGGAAPPAPAANPVDDVVAGVDQTVQGATGVNPNLGGATKPITGAVDDVLQGVTGNDLGGHVNDVNDGVNGLLDPGASRAPGPLAPTS